jgi:hypothetical protein
LPGGGPQTLPSLAEPLTQLVQSIQQLVAVLQQQAPANVPATPAVDAATAGGGATDAAVSGGGGGCGCGGMQASAGADSITQAPAGDGGAMGAPTAAPKPKKAKKSGGGGHAGANPNAGGSTAGAAPAAPTSGTPVDANLKRKNPRSVAEMMDWVRKEVDNPHENYLRKCGHFSAAAFGWKASGENTALDQWNHASEKHAGDTNPPAGALVFWKTGNPAGHVAVSMGNGMVASSDIRRPGKIDIVPLSEITTKWHADYQGWTPPYFPKAA